jgi:hypothetical protein
MERKDLPRQSDNLPTLAVLIGIGQLFLGLLLTILGVVVVVIDARYAKIGMGIWCGVLFMIAGLIAIFSTGLRNRPSLVASSAMYSSLLIPVGVLVFVLMCVAIDYSRSDYNLYEDYERFAFRAEFKDWFTRDRSIVRARLAANILLLIFQFIVIVLCILQGIISRKRVDRRNREIRMAARQLCRNSDINNTQASQPLQVYQTQLSYTPSESYSLTR